MVDPSHFPFPSEWVGIRIPDSAWKVYGALTLLQARSSDRSATREEICDRTNLSKKSVRLGILWLEKDNRLVIRPSGGKNPNQYRIVR